MLQSKYILMLLTNIFILALFINPVVAQQNEILTIDKCQLTIKDRIVLTSLQTGRIQGIYATIGNSIKAEEPILKLNDEMLKLSFQIAEKQASNLFEFQYAQKNKDLAWLEFETAKKLNERIQGSRSQLEIQELKLKAEHAELQQNQAYVNYELAQLKKNQIQHEMQGYVIKSPIDGTIIELLKHEGEVIQAGEKLGEIININQLYVEGFMPAQFAWIVKTGKMFSAYTTFDKLSSNTKQPAVYDGTVLIVHPEIDDISKTVRFVGVVDNRDGLLRGGMPMKVQIQLGTNR